MKINENFSQRSQNDPSVSILLNHFFRLIAKTAAKNYYYFLSTGGLSTTSEVTLCKRGILICYTDSCISYHFS